MKPKILAVDDEEFNLDIMTEYLENAGFDVVTANDGDVALEKVKEHDDISVIVLDRMMPNMNGMDVIKVLKNDARYKAIPIVMQTAAAQSEQIIEGMSSGVFAYLAKPYQKDLFLSLITSAYDESLKLHQKKGDIQKVDDRSNDLLKRTRIQSCFSG